MTWIIVSVPLLVLAVAVAVVPVFLTAVWESRREQADRPAPQPAPLATVYGHPAAGELSQAAA